MEARYETYDALIASGAGHATQRVFVERADSRAWVRLDDPSSRNAFSVDQAVQLREAISELALDREVRTVILTGTGTSFSTGGHLGLMDEAVEPMIGGPEGAASLWRWLRNEYGAIAQIMAGSDTVFIAAVNGPAVGVAFALVLNCDLILAAESASFVSGFAQIGLVTEAGAAWHLTRQLGYHAAFDLLTSDRPLSAAEACQLGLVSQVVSDDQLAPAAERRAAALEGLAGHVPAMTKAVLRQSADLTWPQAIAFEELAQPLCFSSQGHRDSVSDLLAAAAARRAERKERSKGEAPP